MEGGLFIGELAKRVGVNPKTIRYYESLGLLSEPQRSESGYRLYVESDAERMRFILGAKALGLSLHDIKDIVMAWGAGEAPCDHVSHLLDARLVELDRRIAELVAFRDNLRTYKERVDRMERSPNTPCKHIAGVAAGQFHVPAVELPTVFHK
ncbi:MAG TPA: heavy metal-responsive transcriptional regulator [Pantanalinema sp.]